MKTCGWTIGFSVQGVLHSIVRARYIYPAVAWGGQEVMEGTFYCCFHCFWNYHYPRWWDRQMVSGGESTESQYL